MPDLLAIDDDRLILDCLRYAFPADEVTLHTATTGKKGLDLFEEKRPDAVILDVRLPDASGLDVYRRLRDIDSKVPVIFMTGFASADTAIEAMRLGAFDYLVKPIDPDNLAELVNRAFEVSRLSRVPLVLAEESKETPAADVLIGKCAAMQDIYKSIGRVAPQDVTVLILGESGTGKEMVARAIYQYSRRAKGPFLAINCAAIPENLLESELFGHEKGSFTGADRRRIGKFEQCHGGTLFLDEIGDMSPLMQTKILRVLQDQQFERVGGGDTLRTDVRVIAATNRDLEKRMAEGLFRPDLFYRLNVYTIRLPALRDRLDDLPLLADHFLKRFSRELGKDTMRLAPEALDVLRGYGWPGNVREMQSIIKQAILQAPGPVLTADLFSPTLNGGTQAAPKSGEPGQSELVRTIRRRLEEGTSTLHEEVINEVERLLFTEVLRHTGGNQSHASRILGITRQTLRTKLATLGMEKGAEAEGA